jgi:hypothetical protein
MEASPAEGNTRGNHQQHRRDLYPDERKAVRKESMRLVETDDPGDHQDERREGQRFEHT